MQSGAPCRKASAQSVKSRNVHGGRSQGTRETPKGRRADGRDRGRGVTPTGASGARLDNAYRRGAEPLDIIDRSYFLRRHAPTKTSNRRATRAPQTVEDAPGSTHKHPKAAGALVRATGGLLGVMKVTPCGCDQNFRGVAAPGCKKAPLPSPGEK